MWVSVDLCVVPIGVGVSLSPYVAACERVIAAAGLRISWVPMGPRSKGHGKVMACVRACHVELHGMGARLYTTLKLNTRTDRQQSFAEKVMSVEKLLGD